MVDVRGIVSWPQGTAYSPSANEAESDLLVGDQNQVHSDQPGPHYDGVGIRCRRANGLPARGRPEHRCVTVPRALTACQGCAGSACTGRRSFFCSLPSLRLHGNERDLERRLAGHLQGRQAGRQGGQPHWLPAIRGAHGQTVSASPQIPPFTDH